jgi:hypothetical protein
MAEEVSKLGTDFTPDLSVQVTHNFSQVKAPIKIQKIEANKWKVVCRPKKGGQHKVTVKIDNVVKEDHVHVIRRYFMEESDSD